MIETRSLTKTYGDKTALDGLNLLIPEGELFVLLGPNGAGKTTTLKILTTLLRPTRGEAFIAGRSVIAEPDAVKAAIGYVPDTPALYDKLTGWEFLEFIADIRGVRDRGPLERLLRMFELDDAADMLTETYSHGMRKKLAIAAALIHQPQALFLDEPTSGLDPRSARLIRDLIPSLCRGGMSVLMTTHALEVAERMCDRVGILYQGKLQAIGSIEELRSEHGDLSLEDLFLKLTDSAEEAVPANIWATS